MDKSNIICILMVLAAILAFISGFSLALGLRPIWNKLDKSTEIIIEERNKLSDCVRYSLDKECITLEEVQNFLDTDTDSINNWIFCY